MLAGEESTHVGEFTLFISQISNDFQFIYSPQSSIYMNVIFITRA